MSDRVDVCCIIIGWGKCKDRPLMNEFLEDENLVMLVVNQHHNTSHPKVSPQLFLRVLVLYALRDR